MEVFFIIYFLLLLKSALKDMTFFSNLENENGFTKHYEIN